jgi:transposase
MPKLKNPKPPHPAVFRQQMAELVAAGRRPSELAKEFGCHETSITSCVARTRARVKSRKAALRKLVEARIRFLNPS